MSKRNRPVRDFFVTVGILTACFVVSLLMQDVFEIPEQITSTFAFAVFLIALLTDGYCWGIAASVASLLLVNYAFTFPYFELNFVIPSNAYSAAVMAMIAVMTSALTTKVKHQETMKAESQREKMRANLLRAISHDLRTPLTTIYGSTTMLRENGSRLTDSQKETMLQGIQEDAQWLIRMVENLLAITRIDSGNVQITTVLTAADELVDAALQKFRKRYPEQRVELELPEALILIPMDCMLVEQVLINLMENAVQHAAGLTRILIRVRKVKDTCVFEVIDDGAGIPAERMGRLFTGNLDPKAPVADNAKRNIGIGLSLCATIIRAHGGTIQAENAPGGGAVFRFTMKTEEFTDE